ncbi:MAG: hypothetical protein Q8R29_00615 [bacterium]|nr:hypothetical protein [bacterium]
MYLSNIQQTLSNPTWDIILVLALFAVGFFYGLFKGGRRMAATIIYTYVALTVFSVLPLDKITKIFGTTDEYFVKTGVFLILFILLSLLLGSKKSRGAQAGGGSWWQIFLLSFVQVGFLTHVILNFLPPEKIADLAPLTKNFFAAPSYHLWWMAGPIIIIILLRKLDRG